MAESLSFLHNYGNGHVPWIIMDKHFYVGAKKGRVVRFGKNTICVQDKGLVSTVEKKHVAKKSTIFSEQICGNTLQEKIAFSYRKYIRAEEEHALRALLQNKWKKEPAVLETLLRNAAYVGHQGVVYELKEGSQFRLGNKKYAIRSYGTIGSLCRQHERSIRQKRKQHRQQEQSTLTATYEKNVLTCVLSVNDFVMKTPKGMYQFDAFTCKYSLQKKGDVLVRINNPSIGHYYEHPFVHTSGDICFNGDGRWNDNAVGFGEKISLQDAIAKIVFIAGETATVMRRGYTAAVNPVTDIGTFSQRRITKKRAYDTGLCIYD